MDSMTEGLDILVLPNNDLNKTDFSVKRDSKLDTLQVFL